VSPQEREYWDARRALDLARGARATAVSREIEAEQRLERATRDVAGLIGWDTTGKETGTRYP
jgi:hypothetical protein